jgi:hypothetical protein
MAAIQQQLICQTLKNPNHFTGYVKKRQNKAGAGIAEAVKSFFLHKQNQMGC